MTARPVLALAIVLSGGAAVSAAPVAPRLRLAPCAALGPGLLCGSLEVPEDAARPDGRKLSLNVVVAPALEPEAGAVPLFHLDGGPGVAATNAASFYLGPGKEYRRRRPVVMVDQRGTGGSRPLRCPALESRPAMADMYDLDDVRACRRVLASAADLARYGTEAAAADIDRVRGALGQERIDIWALSYGTQLAQVYLKRFPGRVRSAVLAGAAPLDLKAPLYHASGAQRVLDLLFHDCQMDAACGAAYPELRAAWRGVLERLEKQPVRVPRADPATGAERTVEIRRGPFAEAFRVLLATATGQRNIPRIVTRAAAGDFGPFLDAVRPDSSMFAEGLYLSIVCAEGTARIRPEEIARLSAGTFLGDYRIREQLSACGEWPQAPPPEELFAAPTADVPVLMLSGEMDDVTPPRFAEELCGRLPRCRLVSFPRLGHGPFDLDRWQGGECHDRLANAFFARPDGGRLDVSCVSRMRPPAFALP